MLSAEEMLGDYDFGPDVDVTLIARLMRIYRNQGIQQASEVCSEMLTDGFRISNISAVLALKEEV